MSSNWEVVGKNTKVNTKSQKRTAVEKMPKQDSEVEPLTLATSMFKPFEEKTNNVASKKPLQDRSNTQASPKGNKKPKKPKKQPTSSKHSYETLKEAMSAVSVTTLSEKATQFRIRFPKNPNICLKDMAAYLNECLSCPDGSPAVMDKDFNYPYSKVPKPIHTLLQRLYVEEPTDLVKELLFEHCVKAMIDCITSDVPTWGYRICLQALAHGSPKVCCGNLDRELDKIRNMKNVPKRCLAYLWALGQVGVTDPQCGMKVWLKVMLPMLHVKNLSQYIVHYLENLINTTKDPVAKLSGTVDADNFLLIMRWCNDQSMGLSPTLRERLCDLYRPLRLLATGSPKLKVLFFRRFLEASPEEIESAGPDLLEVAFECLQASQQCFSAWREMYTTALPQTKVLLEYLESRWVEALYKLPRNQFKETIRAFHNTNLDAAAHSSPITSVHEFKAVNDICKQMHQKLTEESKRTLSRCHHVIVPLLVALAAVTVGVFMYDVHTHGGVIENSSTYRTLEKSGILDFMRQVWAKLSVALQQIMGWLQANVPYYWSKLRAALSPYVTYIANSLINVLDWMIDASASTRAQISEVAKAALVLADDMFKRFMVASTEAYEAIRPYLISIWTWVVEKLSSVSAFFRGDIHWCCVRDAVVGYAQFAYERVCDACIVVWSYLLYAAKLVGDYISGENMS